MNNVTESIVLNIDQIIPYVNNARTHPRAQIDKLKGSLVQFGYINPIIVDENNVVVAGHGRLIAIKELAEDNDEWKTIKVLRVSHLTEAERRQLTIADNSIADMSGWDEEMLKAELASLREMEADISLTGLDHLLIEDEKLKTLEETPPEEPEEIVRVSRLGDVWTLGDHILICGDSADPKCYKTILDGASADMIVTDPPYNVNYKGTAGKIQNDNMSVDEFDLFLKNTIGTAVAHLKLGGAIYVWHPDGNSAVFERAMREAGVLVKQKIIWVKNSFTFGRSDYQWRHEAAYYGWREGAAHYFVADRTLSTVIEDMQGKDVSKLSKSELVAIVSELVDAVPATITYHDKPSRSEEHPTMKPVNLIGEQIKNSSIRGQVVLEPFSGSGTAIIACEQLGRSCRAIELDPKFVDVAIKRWITLTGEMAYDQNGVAFEKRKPYKVEADAETS